jgi:hypothetical protein
MEKGRGEAMGQSKRWWMSYIEIGHSLRIGNNVRGEHPILTIARWNDTYGKEEGKVYLLISFCEVDQDFPGVDALHNIT